MTAGKFRLYIAAALFVAWVSYLGYLAVRHGHPVIVSRSQFMAAEFPLVADITIDDKGKPNPEVLLTQDFQNGRLLNNGKVAVVDNLPEMHYPEGQPPKAGQHLLLVARKANGHYEVVHTPAAPGDPVIRVGDRISGTKVYIYPWTGEVESQIRELLK